MCHSLIYFSTCFLPPQHALQIFIHLVGIWGVETKCWVPPLQLHRPRLPMGRPSRILFFNIHKEMGFCINEQQNNCTGYFSFLALRKVQLPSFVKDSCVSFVFSPQMWFNVCGHSAGGRTPSRVVLLPQSRPEHKQRAAGLVGFGNPMWAPHEWVRKGVTAFLTLGMSGWVCLSHAFTGSMLCWVWEFTVTGCSVVTVRVELGREFYLSHVELRKSCIMLLYHMSLCT